MNEINKHSSLMDAFTRFQKQCVSLEETHADLRQQLANSQLQLAAKNRELAQRIDEIEEIKEKLSLTFESITDAIVLVDANGAIELANKKAEPFLDDSKTHFTKTFQKLFLPFIHKSSLTDHEISYDDQGEKRVVIMNSSPAAHGNATVVSIKDITSYRELQNRVAREDRLVALGQVAANVAHEVRNPLGAIEGFARLLKSDLHEALPKSEGLAEKIVYASHQLNCVVSNLLNYARDDRTSMHRQPIMIILNKVLDLVMPMANDIKVELTITCDNPLISAEIDGTRIEQVLSNLLINAVESCPVNSCGKVEVCITENDKYLSICITDNGYGIPAKAISRIFEPFYTLKDGGVGLGLAMCKRIIDTHDGSITVKSTVKQGTEFLVKIPKEQIKHD